MRSYLSFGLLALSALAAAAPLHEVEHAVHEKRHVEPRHWAKRSRVAGDVTLPVRIGLKQSNLDAGHDLLMEVSSHDSPKYANWYSAEEIIDLFAPAQERVDAVYAWLTSAGVPRERFGMSVNKQWVSLDMDVAELEKLLRTEYFHYDHAASGKSTIACDQYHVPAHVQEHVDYITPGLKLMAGKSKPKNLKKRGFKTGSDATFSGPILGPILTSPIAKLLESQQTSMCDQYATPACIAGMYNITQATKHQKGNELGIFEEGDFYAAEDLVEFFTLFSPNIPVTTEPILHGIDGGFAPSVVAGGESDLDFQITYPIIYPQNSVLFQTDDINYATGIEGSGGFLNTFFDAIDGSYCTYTAFGETGDSSIDPVYPDPLITGYQGKTQCGVYKPTNVISISYGEQEDDLPTNYQQRQCSEMMKLGMQGVTIVLASGDSGVAARSTDDGNSDGCLGNGEVFNPDFPASCPYLSALGATYLPPGADYKKDEEIAVTRFPSGGGFSNIYKQPSYQSAAVSKYFANHDPGYKYYNLTTATNNPTEAQTNGGLYNRGGRGYPDFSAVGDNVIIILDGMPTLIGGTSASAPVFAAIINRVNEERLAAGKKTVGFVNPTLYAHPEVFHDIANGTNPGCNTDGFSAVKGWDPVTGLGTPNYPKILSLFMGMP